MYVLYGAAFSRALIVEMVMAEGDVAYELRAVDLVKQEHRTPAFLAINPSGLVPALITPEGETLCETPAINLYLAERHGLTRLVPGADEPERGQFLSGLFFLTGEIEPAMKRYFYPHRYAPRAEDAPAIKEQSLAGALERLGPIEARLHGAGPYRLGARFSLVDITLAYWASFLDFSDTLEPFPALRHCLTLVADRPKLRAKFADLAVWRDRYRRLQARGEGVQ